MDDKKGFALGYALTLVSALSFSVKGIFAKMLYAKGLDPVALLAIRFAIATPLFWAFIFFAGREKIGFRDTLILVLSGLIGLYLAALADFYGLLYIDATLERVILYTYPAVVVMLAAIFFNERLNKIKIASILLTYAGLALVLQVWNAMSKAYLLGAGLVFFSAVIYSVSYLVTESLGKRVSGLRMSAYSVTSAAFAFLGTWAFKGIALPDGKATWGLLLLLGVLSTFIPALTLAVGIRIIGASRAALVSFVGPVATAMLSNVMLGEGMDAAQILGMGLIISGVGIVPLTGNDAINRGISGFFKRFFQ